MHELVVRGGTVVDGTGAPGRVADVVIDDGEIIAVTEPGEVGAARREIDAGGLLVLPGWVDIHTHYDGQVTWDPDVTPSSWHGVTTVVMGNCGVGFAPVRPGGEGFLIELMEGVEDIPGTALHEGIDWRWESFPEYLDALASQPRVLDVAAQVPHAALRAYVMGDRAHEEPTADEIAEMARLTAEALAAGAAGLTTSRTILHSSRHGLVPGTSAVSDELVAMGEAIGRAGHGVFQLVSDQAPNEPERSWMLDVARSTGATVTYALAQTPYAPRAYRDALADADSPARACRSYPRSRAAPPGCSSGCSRRSTRSSPTRPTARWPTNRWPSGWPASGGPRCGPRWWPRSPPRATRSPAR
jgi:N-acyl-D-aspartate/D-glutamate deacylase